VNSTFRNGRVYVNGRNKGDGAPWGLHVYSVPGGQELGAYTTPILAEPSMSMWTTGSPTWGWGAARTPGGSTSWTSPIPPTCIPSCRRVYSGGVRERLLLGPCP